MKDFIKQFTFLAYLGGYAFIYAGWLFHKSHHSGLFPYSGKYVVFLLAAALPFCLPVFLGYFAKRIGWKNLFFLTLPILTLSIFTYIFFSLQYAWTQTHNFDPYLQERPARFRLIPRAPEEHGFRILCLGGSTTENIELPPERRYPSRLGQILQAQYPAYSIEVLNAGTAWFSSKHSLINYVTYYREWSPDLVIVLHAMNDLYRSFSPPEFALGDYDEMWSHFYGPSISGAKPRPFEKYLLRELKHKTLLGFSFKQALESWYSTFRYREADFPLGEFVSIGKFEQYMRALSKYVKQDGGSIVLVTQPSLYKETMTPKELSVLRFGREMCRNRFVGIWRFYPSPRSLNKAMGAFNAVTKRVALTEGAFFVDAASHIKRDLGHFTDDVHYTERGSARLATLIAEKVIESEIIDRHIEEHDSIDGRHLPP